MTVLGAFNWKSNAELIEDAARLGYIQPTDMVLDPTYHRGIWWKKFRPANLIHHNWKQDGVDFRDLPYADGFFNVVAFDPPYVSTGGRDTSTIDDFNARYGLHDTPRSPLELHRYNCLGLRECVRVSNKYVLMKVCDYISSGKRFPGVYEMEKFIYEELKLKIVDEFLHYSIAPRPQPQRTRKDGKPSVQKHARNNYSVLLVVKV
jgi:hypothetical protein